jgi:hypothetical protein
VKTFAVLLPEQPVGEGGGPGGQGAKVGQDYLDAGEGFWRLMDAGVVKEAICTPARRRGCSVLSM